MPPTEQTAAPPRPRHDTAAAAPAVELSPRLARDEGEALRVVAATLHLLFDRYGMAAEVGVRGADGTLVPLAAPPAADQVVLGSLAAPASAGTYPAAVEAVYAGPDRPVTLVFHARRRGEGVAVWMHAPAGAAAAGVDPRLIPGHVERVTRAAVEQPELRFGALDVLTDGERRELMETLNGPRASYAATTLHGMFSAQAERTPQAVALVDGARQMTYAELEAASNRVANQLRPHVARPGQVIAVGGVRSLETLAVKIGVMKAGAAFMYLSPSTPHHRAAAMCAVASPAALVASRDTPAVPGAAVRLGLEELLANESASDARPREIADESTAAYVLFTSGSTGQPKGVVRPHRMNTTRVFLEQGMYGLGADDRHLMKSVPFFREFFWGLATGGSLIIARPGGERDDAYLVRLIREHGITVCSFVPSMLRVLLANPAFRESPLPIRHLFVAGEPLDAELEGRLRELGLSVHVTYTLAEADYVTHRGGPPAPKGRAVDVGRPLDMRVYLCDERGRLRPRGCVGEIFTGGPGLADGYLNRPDLTAERFVANPFDPDTTRVLFRTGDLARFDADGSMEYVGRADTQVKIRGQRVEPTEVEQVMRGHDEVDNVAVASLHDPDQGNQLIAYVVPRSARADLRSIRAYLAERLPSYMVPSYIVLVPTLPLLESGKADRAGLRTVLRARRPELGPPTPPEDETQRRVAAVWSKVLGVDEVGVDDTFLELGGDSLKAMLLRIALEADLGVQVGLAALAQSPTVRDLAQHIEDAA